MKICKGCLTKKSAADFYRHPMMGDRRLNFCKECVKERVKKRYRATLDARHEYERRRWKNPERRAWLAEAVKRHRLIHPDRYKARMAVRNAVRSGKLIRQACEVCGSKAEAHHEDYSKPLEVRWLCRPHHRAHEGRLV